MELLFNLVWIAISATALFAWASWRQRSSSETAPGMWLGVGVVVCLLALLFPVISISDDLSQVPGLAETNRLQDVLKTPDLRTVFQLTAILPADLLALQPQAGAAIRNFNSVPLFLHEHFWAPSIDKRPPPQLA